MKNQFKAGDIVKCLSGGFNVTQHPRYSGKTSSAGKIYKIIQIWEGNYHGSNAMETECGCILYNDDHCELVSTFKIDPRYEIY